MGSSLAPNAEPLVFLQNHRDQTAGACAAEKAGARTAKDTKDSRDGKDIKTVVLAVLAVLWVLVFWLGRKPGIEAQILSLTRLLARRMMAVSSRKKTELTEIGIAGSSKPTMRSTRKLPC